MQVTETLSDGLKREFDVVVPQADLEARVAARLGELKDRVRINGFRPGKVPVAHLKKVYGRSVMAETIDATVRDITNQIVTDRGFKLAIEPKVTLPEDQGAVENLIAGKSDLAYKVAIEIVPQIKLADFKGITLEKLVADVTDSEVDEAVARIAEQNAPYVAKPDSAKAETGDRVTVSFTGTIDGAPFEGGDGDNIAVDLGSNTFIPGFEEQLIGIAVGETRTVTSKFPVNYLKTDVAGKEGTFEVTAKSIEAKGKASVDEDFAKALGMESLAKLKDAIKGRIQQEHHGMSRQKLKRALFDKMDELHKFEPPPSMVEEDFNGVWKTIENDLANQNRTFADENTTEETARAEYHAISERRVRLGLVLAEIGEKNNIKVAEEELTRAMVERARQFPGQEQQIWDYFRKNPGAVANLRAPIFEDKVVDFLIELASVTEKKVSREELAKDDEAPAAA